MRIAAGLVSVLMALIVGAGCIHVRVNELDVSDHHAHRNVTTGFVKFSTQAEGEVRPAVVFVPDGYDPDEEWPLIVFLHGIGERGNDGWRQTEVGIGKAIRWYPERFPALVLMPQCAPSTVWSSMEHANGAPAYKHIDEAIEYVTDRYNVDPDRVTLTGLSMGGYGVFHYGAMRADRFAAFMPLCGGGSPDDAAALARRPLWAFHGADDTAVAPEQSEKMVEAIRAEGGAVKYTVYPGVGHNCWDRAYGDAETIAWLLAQER